eukprot:CAMPEP_0115346984 /NCGR_PEP_ID=MMETSP0270-20121206/94637_1 /TAXON_ID=71861 /ORGANISM="Scrippsiella trochoidea, Strain CCMP3099" /LENGTH=119 /DNA_ID=CAMNT_0002768873 /DNA_START=589 /DNA_END=948 /DNA_ORIENTATION=+
MGFLAPRVITSLLKKLDAPSSEAEMPPSRTPFKPLPDLSARAIIMGPATATAIPSIWSRVSFSPRTAHARRQTKSPFNGSTAVIGPALFGSLAKARVRFSMPNADINPAPNAPAAFHFP